jgi:hypothetical protein
MGFALRIICLQTWIVSFCYIWKEIIKIPSKAVSVGRGGPRHPCATIEYDVPTQLIYIGIKYEQPIGTIEYLILYCSDFSNKKNWKQLKSWSHARSHWNLLVNFWYGVWAHTKLAPVSLASREGSGAKKVMFVVINSQK